MTETTPTFIRCLIWLAVVATTTTATSTPKAAAILRFPNTNDEYFTELGIVEFEAVSEDRTKITKLEFDATGHSSKKHGVHVHMHGVLYDQCRKALGHWNPTQNSHGGPESPNRHIGDLGNFDESMGHIQGHDIEFEDSRLPLRGPHSIVGRTVVVHAGEDDLGTGGDKGSKASGNSGSRIGCGVVGKASDFQLADKEPPSVAYPLLARVHLTDKADKHFGDLKIHQTKNMVAITISLKDLTPNYKDYVIKLLKTGYPEPEPYKCGANCKNAVQVGAFSSDQHGQAIPTMLNNTKSEWKQKGIHMTLVGPKSIVGQAMILTKKTEDPQSLVAWGVIGIDSDYNPGPVNSSAGMAYPKTATMLIYVLIVYIYAITAALH